MCQKLWWTFHDVSLTFYVIDGSILLDHKMCVESKCNVPASSTLKAIHYLIDALFRNYLPRIFSTLLLTTAVLYFLLCVRQSGLLSVMGKLSISTHQIKYSKGQILSVGICCSWNQFHWVLKLHKFEVVTITLGNIKIDLNQVCLPLLLLCWNADLSLPMMWKGSLHVKPNN